jgi:hypothetical protein
MPDSSSARGKVPHYFKYVRDIMEWEGITIFTDGVAYDDCVEIVKSRYKIAWFLEPRAISPMIYVDFPLIKDKFDFTMTYDDELLKQYPLNTKFVPFGSCWIRNDFYSFYRKTRKVSMIYSKKNYSEGHILRHQIASRVKGIDLYGKGSQNPIPYKETGLIDYMFSVAIENSCQKNYFTEKILDCFAVGTIPIYWGCPNIDSFFDHKGIIYFSSPEDLENIVNTIDMNVYFQKMDSILRNFDLIKEYEIPEDWVFKNVFKDLLEKG